MSYRAWLCVFVLSVVAGDGGCGGRVQTGTPADDIGVDGGPTADAGTGGQPSGGGKPAEMPGDGSDGGATPKPDDNNSGMRVGTNFWFLADWAERAFQVNVDFASATDPWNPAFLADLTEARYAAFRFMDFGGTNGSTVRDWSERTAKTSADNRTGGDVNGRGIAYEWMFDLCNRMQADCWITLPHLSIESFEADAQNNYFSELARLAKAQLDPARTLYIEYSNETWNGGFAQARYVSQRGVTLGYDSVSYAAGFMFHVHAAVRMYEAFAAVYGADAARVKLVLAGQLGGDYGTTKQLAALSDAKINPKGTKPAYYAISSYVSAGESMDGAAPGLTRTWADAVAATVQSATKQAALLAGSGMTLIAYEGGQHITTNADAFSRNPSAYAMYTEWLDAISGQYALTMHYGHSGSWSSGAAWGAREYAGQPLANAPKARALVDWMKAHR